MIKKLTIISLLAISPSLYGETNEKENVGTITVEDESEVMKLTHSPMPVSVIDMEKFHGRNISLNEILKRVAGVKVMQRGGLGSKSTIAIHGLEGKRVKIFIDGSPLNSPDGSLGINDIPIQLIERIEVYKGVVPAKFGGDALGGAINVVTKEFEGSYIDFTYSGGSYDTYRSTLVLKRNFDKQNIEVGMGGFFNSAANDYVMNSPYFKDLKIKRDHDNYSSFIAVVGLKIKERWFDDISFELAHYESQKEIQGIKTTIKEAKTKSAVNIFSSKFEKDKFFIDDLEFEYGFTYLDLASNYIDKAQTCYNFDGFTRPCPGNGGEINGIPHDSKDKQEDFRHDLNLHYLINNDYSLNFHINSQSSKYEPHDDLASQILGYDTGDFPSKKTNTVYSLGLESSFLKAKLVNDVGLKSYHYDYEITSQERTLTGKPAQSKNDGSEFGFYESIRYEPLEDLFVKASYEHAFRLPDSSEIFGDGVSIVSSPKLTPEEADNFNLGFMYDKYDFYGLPWLKAEVNFFYRDLKNMIKLEHSFLTSSYVNLGKVEVKGFELELQADLNENWYVYGNYTNQSLTNKQKILQGTLSTPNPTYNLDIPNVPAQYANLGVEYKRLGLFKADSLSKIFWEANWADEYDYDWKLSRNQDRKIESQFTHTAGLEYSFNDDHYIFGFEVRNLTDEKITDVFNYPLMGRTYHLNLRYTWFEN